MLTHTTLLILESQSARGIASFFKKSRRILTWPRIYASRCSGTNIEIAFCFKNGLIKCCLAAHFSDDKYDFILLPVA